MDTKTKVNPFAHTWKANLSKSQRHPNHLFQSATLHFEVSQEAVLLTYTGVNMAGEQESGTGKFGRGVGPSGVVDTPEDPCKKGQNFGLKVPFSFEK